MAQKMTGALVFDERTDRYDIRFDLGLTRKRRRRKTQSRNYRIWKGADPCRNRVNLRTWICSLPSMRL